jgi:hypothetical protein
MHHPFILANLGQAELELGMYRDAAEHLSQFLRENPLKDDKAARVEEMLKRAQANIGTLTFRGALGTEVFVDGSPVGQLPIRHSVFVAPGFIELVARSAGHQPMRTGRLIQPGDRVEVDLTIPTPKSAARPQPIHEPVRTGASGPTNDREVIGARSSGSWASWPVLATGGVALAGGGVATVFGILYATSPTPKESWSETHPELVKQATYRNVLLVSGIVVGVAAAGTVGLLIVGKTGSEPKADTAIVVAPGPGGIVVAGKWR